MKLVAGMDVGGTKCASLLADCAGDRPVFLSRREFPTAGTPDEAIGRLCSDIEAQTAALGVSGPEGVGISCGGPLDSAKGVIAGPPNLPGWDRVPIARIVEERLGCPAKLKNDADACALAEYRYGAGRGVRNMVFITFGTGCGAGLILDGRLYTGANDFAGELGHWRMADHGPEGYGKAGSLEGFCSGGGLARLAVLHKEKGRASVLYPACEAGMVTARQIADAARAGDGYAKELIDQSADTFGKALALVIDLLNPERIVAGGVFMRAFDLFYPRVRERIEREALPFAAAKCAIEPSRLGEQIGDYGAVCAFLGDS